MCCQGDEEIEIDIDAMDNGTLRELQVYVDSCLRNKRGGGGSSSRRRGHQQYNSDSVRGAIVASFACNQGVQRLRLIRVVLKFT